MQHRHITVQSQNSKPNAALHTWGIRWNTAKPPKISRRAADRYPDQQVKQIGMSILAWNNPISTINPCSDKPKSNCPTVEEEGTQLVAKMKDGDTIPNECLDCITRTLGLLTEGMPATSQQIRQC